MNLPQQIRWLSKQSLRKQLTVPGRAPIPNMRPFFAVPIKERLVLLALYDSRTMGEIKEAMPWVKETDVRLTSRRIHQAIELLEAGFEDDTIWMNPGPVPMEEVGDLTDTDTQFPFYSRRIPEDTEVQLRKYLWPATTLVLFGEHVPPKVGKLTLKQRAIVYMVVVEEMTWIEVERMMECSKTPISTSLTRMVEALGG